MKGGGDKSKKFPIRFPPPTSNATIEIPIGKTGLGGPPPLNLLIYIDSFFQNIYIKLELENLQINESFGLF